MKVFDSAVFMFLLDTVHLGTSSHEDTRNNSCELGLKILILLIYSEIFQMINELGLMVCIDLLWPVRTGYLSAVCVFLEFFHWSSQDASGKAVL